MWTTALRMPAISLFISRGGQGHYRCLLKNGCIPQITTESSTRDRVGTEIIDPFAGSSTTGIAANLLGRRFLGIDSEKEYLEISKQRRHEIESPDVQRLFKQKINGFNSKQELTLFLTQEPAGIYSAELPL